MNLKKILEKLENLPCMEATVKFSGSRTDFPVSVCSWRGKFEQITISSTDDIMKAITVEKLYEMLNEAMMGAVSHIGYKGGEYFFSPSTVVWCDRYGTVDYHAPIEVIGNKGLAVIKTEIQKPAFMD